MSDTNLSHPGALATDTIWTNPAAPPNGRRLSPEARSAIALAGELGFPQSLLARAYGVSRSTVLRVIKRAKKNPGQMSRDLTEVRRLQADLLRANYDPETVRELGALLGVVRLMRLEDERTRRRPKKGKRK